MGSKNRKPSILEELAVLPAKRGTWFSSIPPADQAQLEEVRQAFRGGKLNCMTKELCAFLINRFSLTCTMRAIRQWLEER